MKNTILLTGILALNCMLTYSQTYTINTYAGTVGGYSGDNGPATSAELYLPYGVNIDKLGNLYIAEANQRIRKINTSGIIKTIAGNGYLTGGYSGDGGQATSAELNYPAGVAVDISGNIFIADGGNNRIRKVKTNGIISTFAGNGVQGYYGDGGNATSAELNVPEGICLSSTGDVYIADQNNSVIRKVNTSGIIATIAGIDGTNGFSGDGGQATLAELGEPSAIGIDGFGIIFIPDYGNGCIRMINTSGIITTVAGVGGISGFSGDGGPATSARLFFPQSVMPDTSNNLFISDNNNQRIRKVNSGGIISTIAGNGVSGFTGDGGLAKVAELNHPCGLCKDALGNIYIADESNNRIRKLTSNTTGIDDIAGSKYVVNLFPNPNSGKFTIQLSDITGQFSVEIYNVLGEKVYSQSNIHNSTSNIDLRSKSNGVYLYRVISENGTIAGEGKFAIVH